MNLQEISEKIKSAPDLSKDVFVLLLIIAVGLIGFMLGRLDANEKFKKDGVRLLYTAAASSSANVAGVKAGTPITSGGSAVSRGTPVEGMYVGSRTGKSYHLPSCPGAQKIKEANKVWFKSKEEAQSRGYRPAGNCPGLQ